MTLRKHGAFLVVAFGVVAYGGQAAAQTCTTLGFTGAAQTFVVPGGVTQVSITARGAQGTDAAPGGTGGLGGEATGNLVVTSGETLNVFVGGRNGFNGGGAGAVNGNSETSNGSVGSAPSGGGASDVRQAGVSLAERVIVAGGGGGGGNDGVWGGCQPSPGANGGAGGAAAGTPAAGFACNCAGGGGDGGQPGAAGAGGAAGGYAGNTACLRGDWTIGVAGSLGVGGNGSTTFHNGTGGGGGGGGGYYGGGAGGSGSDTTPGGGGGGGSSFVGGVTGATTTAGVRAGDGEIQICAASTPVIPTLGEWGMILMVSTLAAVALWQLRRRPRMPLAG